MQGRFEDVAQLTGVASILRMVTCKEDWAKLL